LLPQLASTIKIKQVVKNCQKDVKSWERDHDCNHETEHEQLILLVIKTCTIDKTTDHQTNLLCESDPFLNYNKLYETTAHQIGQL
jgi:hypothetical protein